MGIKNSRRVILPLKRSLMEWIEEFDKLEVGKFGTQYLGAKDMISEDYKKPTVKMANQKTTYEEYYLAGFSINEIAELFGVSKQYVDTMLGHSQEFKNVNVENREKIKKEIEYKLYVKVPEEYGFDKVKDIGYSSNEYILRRKYKEYGGKKIKSFSELKEETVEKVWEDFNKGMSYRELSEKYNKKINTISNYIREKRLEEGFDK